MKAVVYQKPYELTVTDVPDPTIEDPREMIVKVTSTCICGFDLHLFHGLYPHMPGGTTIGHEFL